MHRDRSRGQALTELAIVVPVMMFLVLGALDLARVFYAKIAVTNAAMQAVLTASEGSGGYAAAAVAESRGGFVAIQAGDVAAAVYSDSVNKCSTTATFGSTVAVTVRAPFHAIAPFIGTLIGGQDIMLEAMASAQCAVLPTATLAVPTPPSCPVVSFTATNSSNGGHPHRMSLAGSISPSSSGWTWTWSGGLTATGQNVSNHDFPSSGPTSVTLTVSKGSCSPSTTQTVVVP